MKHNGEKVQKRPSLNILSGDDFETPCMPYLLFKCVKALKRRVKKLNLVYKEYIYFLKKKGIIEQTGLELTEGYYWYDRSIIKAYDKNGKIHKVVRLKVEDDLTITFKTYKDKPFEIESWKETVERNETKLIGLEEHGIKLIEKAIEIFEDRTVAILSSFGKDSLVVQELVNQVQHRPSIIFNNTSLDCADTYRYMKKQPNVTVISPKEGFYQWRQRQNFIPTRFSRACRDIFKEGAMVDFLPQDSKYIFFMGMRNQESNTRSGYADIWKNHKWGDREWDAILPIRSWSEEEIWLYILYRRININIKYKKGYTRCGCSIACPYYTKSTWTLDEFWFPNMYKRWHDILDKDFVDNKKASVLNCTNQEYHLAWNGGMVRKEPTEEVILEFAEQQDLDLEIANKYFNKNCMCCNKKLKKDDIALSMKYYGRQIEKFKCKKCLSKDLNVTTKVLKEKIKEFKADGCSLF